jgi:succinyl-diaminopimelate desuccinylase
VTEARTTDLGAGIDAEAVVEFTRELVRVRSVADGAGRAEEAAARVVADRMRGFGWDVAVSEVAPGRPNLIATVTCGLPGPTLAFEGHLDVVTEGDATGWSHPPYAADVVDGRLYGRGAADMKSGVAAMIYAVHALEAAGPFRGTVKVCVLADEEGMMLGAKQAAASGALHGVDGVIVCEPEGDEVCTCAKGAVRLRLDLTGSMAHGAMPDRGANPIPALAACLSELSGVQEAARRASGAHPVLGETWITPTVVRAGDEDQVNVIPAAARLYVDVRTVPGTDHAGLVETARQRCASAAAAFGVRVALTVMDDRPPVQTPVEHPVVAAIMAAHEQVTGSPAQLGGVPGTTDGTILSRDAELPTVVYGPGGKWIAHQMDEFVEVADILRYTQTYAAAARLFLGSG